jgi:hypothetical protein
MAGRYRREKSCARETLRPFASKSKFRMDTFRFLRFTSMTDILPCKLP